MRPFTYMSPTSLPDALAILGDDHRTPNGNGGIRPLAGGTDLLTLMKSGVAAPDHLIDIKRIHELSDRITVQGDMLVIGAIAKLSEIADHPLVREHAQALGEAAASAATPQLRNMATIGGNLLQRPRCWYFRNPQVTCWLKGGDECTAVGGENQQHALFAGSPCLAVHPSDAATALVALGAEIRIHRANGERTVSAGNFFALPTDERRNENLLRADELITEIHLPLTQPGTRSTYLKAMDRKVWAFALVGVAVSATVADGKITSASIVLGGVAPIPWRATAAEHLLTGGDADPDLFHQAAEAALADAETLEHNGYKVPLAKTLIRRALAGATSGTSKSG